MINNDEITTEIKTVRIIRPLKITSLVCAILSSILGLVSISTNHWVQTTGYHQGLWSYCETDAEKLTIECNSVNEQDWLIACAVFSTLGFILECCVSLMNLGGLLISDKSRKRIIYLLAAGIMSFAAVCEVIVAIVFPVVFIRQLHTIETLHYGNSETWYISWSYGLCWSSAVFAVGSAVLLFSKHEHSQVYYKEKVFTNGVRTA